MDYQILQNPFLNIPRKKLDDAISDLLPKFSKDGVLTQEGALLAEVFQRYWAANIPVDYWYRDMHNFTGSKGLKKRYEDVTADLKESYKRGVAVCFAASHGTGKTLTTSCILKRVVEKNVYSALYVNMVDIIHVMLTSPNETKILGRDILMSTDFLVIDEIDQRFIGSDNAADLFGRILEPVIRGRIQNRLPIFFCTNSPQIETSFTGALKASMESLMKVVTLQPVVGGKDARAEDGKR